MDRSVPANLTSGQYFSHVTDEWTKLLDLPGVDEKQVQAFLEEHPCLLPFGEIPLANRIGHPLSSAVVTQPVLPGLKSKVPDFMYFTGNSGEIKAVFIEIESPSKKWFTKSGQKTAELTQAECQIKSWKAWFSDPANVLAFERDYLVRNYGAHYDRRTFIQEYILVIGRRCDISDPTLINTRHQLQGEQETWMTYDRLQCSPHWNDAVTVRIDRSGTSHQFLTSHVPPMLKLGPHHYPKYHRLDGVENAIKNNTLMSQERQTFLLSRIPYWQKWLADNGGIGCVNGRDFDGE